MWHNKLSISHNDMMDFEEGYFLRVYKKYAEKVQKSNDDIKDAGK